MKFHTVLCSSTKRLFGKKPGKRLGIVLLFASALTGVLAQADDSRWVPEDRLSELVDSALLPAGANVDVKFVKADERLGSLKCPAALFANSSGNKMWGRTFVRVQCVGSDTPPFFLGVDVKVWTSVLVIRNMVQSGQTVGAGDVEYRTMDLSQLTQGWVTDMAHLANKTSTRQLWPGTLLKHDHLRGQPMVKNGDTVKVVMSGPGFAIGGTAVAMGEAELGEVVKIKTAQGKILHGVAREALMVEVNL